MEQPEADGYAKEGFIIQEYVEMPEAFGYHYMVGSWSIDDTAAGMILRGDHSRITGRHCLMLSHIVLVQMLADP